MKHDYLSVVRNRKQLIIKSLLIWVSLTQRLEVREEFVSGRILHFLSAGKAFCFSS